MTVPGPGALLRPDGASGAGLGVPTGPSDREFGRGSGIRKGESMEPTEVLDVGREAVIVLLKTGGPIMLIALGVGLTISLLQALTQIQEMTLAFVPKILVVFTSLLVLMPYMINNIMGFMERLADRIISLGVPYNL